VNSTRSDAEKQPKSSCIGDVLLIVSIVFLTKFTSILMLKTSQLSVQSMAENEEISIVYSGMLHKKGGVQGSWEHRFFVLKSDGQMRYYSQPVSGLDGDPDAMKGVIDLDTASRCISNADAKLSEPNKGLTVRLDSYFLAR
jgi:hypothetical protein